MTSYLPDEIDAGADFSLKFRVRCKSECGLTGGTIKIIDGDGNTAAEAAVSALEEGADTAKDSSPGGIRYETESFTVKAPALPGEYTWKALYSGPADEEAGKEAAETPESIKAPEAVRHTGSLEFSFKVRSHLISISIWDVPMPANKGEKFAVSIGAACSSGCSLAGQTITIEDSETGKQVAQGKLGDELLAQTKATYWTRQELDAPSDEAVHRWTVRCQIPEGGMPHQTEGPDLVFRTAAVPKYTVTIKVTDDRDFLPLNEANIQLGLYKTVSDKDGVAVLKVPEGEQELVVVKMDYITHQSTVTVNEDSSLSAALEFSPQL
ncbi:MAG: carboxypeptidase-like regulatory domain-containing protein, partial [Spirochaetaceae bacterium]|jgi:hypothetical protein|nr:carboxypeptidase-like regulatory domain-containing protein [Spirochaetaceae bacterium]